MPVVDRNTVIVDRSLQAADPRLEKTTDSRSPQTQKCNNIQEINEDNHQTHKIYHFENCGTVYMDSFNTHSVKMENCGNNTPKVTCSSFLLSFSLSLFFSSNLATSSWYYSDHRPRIIGNEKFLHSQSHAVSSGMWALALSAIKYIEYVHPSLGLQSATGYPTAQTENAKSKHSNIALQMDAFSLPQSSQPILPSHFSGDHTVTRHNIKYLEQLLDSSLATVAVIQFSGSPLPDVLTPRAYDTFKALYALAALDAPASSTKPRESEIPTCSTFSDIQVGNDCPNRSPPLPKPSLAVPRTGRIHVHISIPVNYVMIFSWVGLAAVSCLVVIFLGFAKGSSWRKQLFRRQGIYIRMLTTSCNYLVPTCIIDPRFAVSSYPFLHSLSTSSVITIPWWF